jgi:translation elongation factor EF-G
VQLQEPVMHVRVQVALRHVEAVRRAMLAREALALEEYSGLRYAVLRYEAPLARLIGLPAEIARLTDESAQHWVALSHYALVTGDPDGGPKRAA